MQHYTAFTFKALEQLSENINSIHKNSYRNILLLSIDNCT